ncbi:hypothetical protein D3C72_1708570 [compost metagenome]
MTVPVNCSIDVAVSSIEPACCSVRFDRSRLPAAISRELVAMVCVPARTWLTMATRLSRMPRMAYSKLLRSFGPVVMVTARLPAAISPAMAAA